MLFLAVALWGAFMMAAIFYTQEARHADSKPLAAYLLFITLFSLIGAGLFAAFSLLVRLLELEKVLDHPGGAAAFLAAVFVPAFILADRQLRKPPRPPHYPHGSGTRNPIN